VELKVGTIVAYPPHGVGRVAKREKRVILGVDEEVVVIELANELAADARAAGITQLVATVCGDNPRVMALLERLGSLSLTWRGGERELVIGLEH